MTEELKERIAVKLFFIEQEAAQIRKWIEAGTDKDPAFLAELNATSTNDAEPQGEYKVTMIASAHVDETPGLPDLTDMATLAEEIAKAKAGQPEPTQPFKQELDWEHVVQEDERYQKVCAWLINQPIPVEKLESFQREKKLRFDLKDFDHLRNLIWFRDELLKGKDGAFDLKSILSQSDTRPEEKPLWEALDKTLK